MKIDQMSLAELEAELDREIKLHGQDNPKRIIKLAEAIVNWQDFEAQFNRDMGCPRLQMSDYRG